jgi:hypothetical protein
MSDYRRVDIYDDEGAYYLAPKDGTHALLPWEKYDRLRAEVERLTTALEQMADHGCGLTTVRDGELVQCRDRYPTNREEWCLSCMAAAVLESTND